MLKRSLIPCAVVALLTAVPWLQASSFAQQPKAMADTAPKVHFEGCVFTEAALTATKPIVVTAGTHQAFVLTNVKVIAGSVPDAEASRHVYALDGTEQEALLRMNGKRVGVVGRVVNATPRPKLEIISVRDISGGCPTLPGPVG